MTDSALRAVDEGAARPPFFSPAFHVHEQPAASAVWAVAHPLPGFPGVRAWVGPPGAREAVTPAAVAYLGPGRLEVRFDREVAGAAVLRP